MKKMRKFLYFWFLIAFINTGTAQINLTIVNTETCINTVSVPIIIEENQTLVSLQFTVFWDGSGLSFNSLTNPPPSGTVSLGPIPGPPPNNLADTITYAWLDFNGYAFSPGDTVALLNFDVTGTVGPYPVSFYLGSHPSYPVPPEAGDPDFNEVEITANNGEVTVGSTIPVFVDCPTTITTGNDPGMCGAVVNWTEPTVSDCDNNDNPIVPDPNNPSPGFLAVGNYTVTYSVDDADGNMATCTFDINISDTEAPTITCPADISQNVAQGTTTFTVPGASLTPIINDNCGTPDVTYSFSGDTPGSGTFTGQDLTFNLGTTIVTYIATDGVNSSPPCTFTVTIIEVLNPVDLDIGDVTADCSNTIDVPVVILDDITLVSLSFTIIWEGSGLSFNSISEDDIGSGTVAVGPLPGAPPNNLVDTITFAWSNFNGHAFSVGDVVTTLNFTVTGNVGDSYSVLFYPGNSHPDYPVPPEAGDINFNSIPVVTMDGSVTIADNVPPTITCPDPATIACGSNSDPSNTGGSATAVDDCDPNPAVSFTDLVDLNSCNNTGTITRTWTATDASGNPMSCDQIIMVVDNMAPTFTAPAAVTLNCEDDVTDLTLAGDVTDEADNCDTSLDATYTDDTSGLTGCNGTGTIIRTWTLTDDCGGTVSHDQTITIVDNEAPTFTAPAAVTLNCEDDVTDLTLAGDVTDEADNCDTSLDATYTDDTSGLTGCNNTGTIIRTWTLTDDCGLSVSHTQTITIEDNTGPTFTAPATVTINCEDDPTDLTLTGDVTDESDNCDTSLEATYTDNTSGLTDCNNTGTIIRTWSLTDDCGMSVTHTQTITVVDNTNPTFTVPPNIAINCNEDPLDLTITGDVFDEADNCSTGLEATFTDVPSGTSSCGGPSQIIRTWTLIDACGNTTTQTQIITLTDSPPPTFTAPPAVTINCDDDPDDLSLTGDVTDESSSCAMNVEATYVDDNSGLTGCNGTGQIVRTWTLDDGCSFPVSHIQIITVVDVTAPTFTAPAPVTIGCEIDVTDLSITGDVTDELDNCSTNLEATYTDNTSGLNGCNGTGQIIRTWTLIDDCGNTTPHTQIITVIDNSPPTFTAPAGITIGCEINVLDLSVTGDVTDELDNCSTNLEASYTDDNSGLSGCNGTGTIIRTWVLTDDCGNTVSHDQIITVIDNTAPTFTVPSNITIDCIDDPTDLSITGDVTDEADNCSSNLEATYTDDPSGTSGCGGPSQIIRTWTLIDDCGNATTQTQIITLIDSPPPTFTPPPAVTINCNDDPNDLSLTGDVTDESSSCAMNVEATYTDDVSMLTDCNGTGLITRTWTLDDGCSGVVSHDQIITVVDNTAPTFTAPAAITLNCEDDVTDLVLTGDVTDEADNCDTSLDATYTDDNTGLTGCSGTGTIIRTWTLTDDCGNTVSHDQTITIVDNTAPTFTVPAAVTLNCEDDVTDLVLTGDVTDEADNCDTSLDATYTDDNTGLTGCNGTGTIIRTWTLTDDCGNTVSQDQTITVVDNTAPTFTVPLNITIDCNEDPLDLSITGDVTDEADNCSIGLMATFTDTPSGTSACGGPSQIIRTWTLVDDCGNATTLDQIILLSNTPPPTFDPPPAITINCDDDPTDLTLTGDVTNEMSSCNPNPQTTYTDDLSNLTACNGTGTIIRTWTLDDGCSGIVSHTQTITVVDGKAPLFTVPAAVTLNCEDDVTNLTLTGDVTDETDNCDTSLDATFTDDNSGLTGCNGTGTIIRTWTLTDDCGNTLSLDQTITVVDNTAPTFTAPPSITINCNEDPLDLTVTGDVTDEADNCSTGLEATFTDVASGSTNCGGPSQIIRTWTLTDDCGNTLSLSQVITLEDGTGPVLPTPPDVTINCEDDPSDLNLTGDVNGESSPCTMNVEATYVDDTSGLNGCNGTGTIVRTWTLDDGCSMPVSDTQIITVVDNEAPTFTAPGSLTLNCEDDVTNLSLSGDVTDEADNCSTNLQATFTDDTSSLTGCNNTGTIIRTWTLTDDCGNTVSHTQTITIVDNSPPTFTAPPLITINCNQDSSDLSITGDVTDEADNCSTNLEATYVDNPSGTSVCGGPSQIIRTWTLVDDCGNSVSYDQIILLSDGTAGFSIPPSITINCEDDPTDLSLTGDVNDEFSSCASNIDATYVDNNSGLTGCNETGVIIRTWTLDDGCSSPISGVQVITVVDNEAPTFTTPASVTLSCEDDATNLTLTGDVLDEADNCSINLEATFVDDNTGLTECNGTGVIIRTWTLTDDCGNTVSQDQVITIVDNTPPLAVCQNANIQLDANGTATLSISQVDQASTDNCQNGATLSLSLSQTEFDCSHLGTNIITLVVEDDCGNISTCFPQVTVQDLMAPEIECPSDVTVNNDPGICGAADVWIAASASDNCSSVTVISSHDSNSIFPVGTTIVTNTATDDSGNVTTCTYTVTVLDTEAPVLDCDPGQFQLTPIGDCKVIVSWNAITATDNCSDPVTITSTHSPGDTFMYGMATPVVYVAVDDAGNMASCEFEIDPFNDIPAVLNNCPGDTTIIAPLNSCSVVYNYVPPTIEENCTGMTVECIPPSGSTFPVGTTQVTCNALDDSGNIVGSCSFVVTVEAFNPVPIIATPSTSICEGNDLVLSTNGLQGAFDWTGPNNTSSSNETFTIENIGEEGEGTYELIITYDGGCTASGSTDIIVNLNPIFSLETNSPVCDSDVILNGLQASASPDIASWLWTGPCGFMLNTTDPEITIPDLGEDCDGEFTLMATSFGGCTASATSPVDVMNLVAPDLELACDSVICISESCVLLGTAFLPAPDSYNWLASANGGLPLNTDKNSIQINPLATGQFTYQYWINSGGCTTDTASINVTVVDRPEVNDDFFETNYQTPLENIIVTDNDVIFDQLALDISVVALPQNGSLVYSTDGTFTYRPNDGFIGTDFFLYQMCYNCDLNQCDTGRVEIVVVFEGDCEVPNIITPNGDGINDALEIVCLKSGDFPDSDLLVLNQWGDRVFHASPYLNDWEGTLHGKDGKNLPDATYYYIFKESPSSKAKKGYIMIFR